MTKILLLLGMWFLFMFLSDQLKFYKKIVEIPYEIGRRLLYKTAMGFLQIADNYAGLGYTFVGTVIHEDNKYYLSTRNSINQTYYATAFLILKDI